jgi:hypothetical protein
MAPRDADHPSRDPRVLRCAAVRQPREAAALLRAAAQTMRDLGRPDLEEAAVLVAANVELLTSQVARELRAAVLVGGDA